MYLVAGGRGLAGCGHLSVSLLGLLLLLARSGTRALVCLPCDESKCEEPRNCPGSIVQGVCGCCYMCARQRNESCGGAYGLHGACDRGLRCVIRPPLNGDSITEYEVGVCEGSFLMEQTEFKETELPVHGGGGGGGKALLKDFCPQFVIKSVPFPVLSPHLLVRIVLLRTLISACR
ncbi:hypothetical protein STEG23_030207 [Scotinomys teguina]